MRLVVGISGATGAILGVRTLELLRQMEVETHLVISRYGAVTIREETDYTIDEVRALATVVHANTDLSASIASGSFRTDGMIVAPCSVKTLSAVANSSADSLIARAADVALKERRRVVLLFRETPLHLGHLRLMSQVAENGAIVFPPVLAFYGRPTTLENVIDHIVARATDLFGLDAPGAERWEGSRRNTLIKNNGRAQA
ncbi:MAG: UbiX family flavin prenyltransferase [Acidimicrobiales bacterium]